MYALLSVSDKEGIVEFGRDLVALGYEILSTGGTLKLLQILTLKPLMWGNTHRVKSYLMGE